ncbi:hypothetical protein A0H81_01386 [Grifola frondosa]|uniref:Oxidoreductase YusZ n=1 Tax=Grifola frondosa TaxID=5627 RepID=A0A1C7MT64_GRIFR|nr:hypothetical protein A0H81_01386 [Grifola frondosa]
MAAETRVWLITGTSSGIGLATIKEVLAAGERVAAVTRKASSLAPLVAVHPPEDLLVLEFDVGNPNAAVKPLFQSVLAHFGRVDVVVNNAGYGLNGVVEGTTDEQAREQVEVNFWGPVRISREAVRVFRENNIGGRILNISSIGGFLSNPTLAFYSASKFALEGFSEGLHKELDPTWNIKVITIQLGGARTEWGKSNFRELPLPLAYNDPEGIPNRMRILIKDNTPISDPVKGLYFH